MEFADLGGVGRALAISLRLLHRMAASTPALTGGLVPLIQGVVCRSPQFSRKLGAALIRASVAEGCSSSTGGWLSAVLTDAMLQESPYSARCLGH